MFELNLLGRMRSCVQLGVGWLEGLDNSFSSPAGDQLLQRAGASDKPQSLGSWFTRGNFLFHIILTALSSILPGLFGVCLISFLSFFFFNYVYVHVCASS